MHKKEKDIEEITPFNTTALSPNIWNTWEMTQVVGQIVGDTFLCLSVVEQTSVDALSFLKIGKSHFFSWTRRLNSGKLLLIFSTKDSISNDQYSYLYVAVNLSISAIHLFIYIPACISIIYPYLASIACPLIGDITNLVGCTM